MGKGEGKSMLAQQLPTSMMGFTDRERAEALFETAYPDFHPALGENAKRLFYNYSNCHNYVPFPE